MSNVPAATRTLDILQVLARAGAPLPATSIAKRLSIPRSSTYHLLKAMQKSDFVIHFPEDERWGLGVAAFELGSAYLRHDPLERLARPILSKLVHGVEEIIPAVAQLGILQGGEVLYLARELPRRPVTIVTDVGVRLPAQLTASGRSMLCLLPTSQVRAVSASAWTNRTGLGPKSLKELNLLLAEERKNGFSHEEGFITDGYSSLSVAVTNHLELPVAALAMTFRTEESNQEKRKKIIEALRVGAKELSRRLGSHQ